MILIHGAKVYSLLLSLIHHFLQIIPFLIEASILWFVTYFQLLLWIIEVIGASGGILIMWDRRVVEKIDECVGEFYVACSFRNVEDQFAWAFVGFYGPNSNRYRRFLWDKLAGLLSWWNLPWCIGGDFNVTHFPSERSREAHFYPAMGEFSDFIFE